MKTYKVIQRHCVEDVWIMDAEDKETAMLKANDINPDNTKSDTFFPTFFTYYLGFY